MSFKIVAKYIKSLDFNLDKPDTFLNLTKNISNYKFKIDIKSNGYKDNIIEVQITLALIPKNDEVKNINALATYSVLVEVNKELTDKKKLEEIILIKIPTDIYPDLRKIFIYVFENSGFKEINIDEKVDFKKLYLSRKN